MGLYEINGERIEQLESFGVDAGEHYFDDGIHLKEFDDEGAIREIVRNEVGECVLDSEDEVEFTMTSEAFEIACRAWLRGLRRGFAGRVSSAFQVAYETHPQRHEDPGLAIDSAREDAAELVPDWMTGDFDDESLTFTADGSEAYGR